MGSTRKLPIIAGLGVALLGLGACDRDNVEDMIDDATKSEIHGQVTDNRGMPLAGATVYLYDLFDNTSFVEGGDVQSATAYIDRAAVLASTNAIATVTTEDDGTFLLDDGPTTAFLASVKIDGCTADFAGFDPETGVLNADTLIAPDYDNGVRFEIPAFSVACSTPPEVGPEGNSPDAPPTEPPIADPSCDADTCTSAGGQCDGTACVITCVEETCAAGGGACVEGACELPACDADACGAAGGSCTGDQCVLTACVDADCEAVGGTCSGDGTTCDIPACLAAETDCTGAGGRCSADGASCELPMCTMDRDCQLGQPGAYCQDPGDIDLATCVPPTKGEIVSPTADMGWGTFVITDAAGTVLADASAGDANLPASAIPADGIVRVQASHMSDATKAFLQVQSGGQACPNFRVRTDSLAVELTPEGLVSSDGAFVELVLHGGYQEIQLSTSEVLGEGDRSWVVTVGDACTAPKHPFMAFLTWEAGPGQPADLDLSVWNAAGELVFVGNKQAGWGQIAREGKGPGPEVFFGDDASQGPYTIKVEFFSGKPRLIPAKLRIIRSTPMASSDETFTVNVDHPKAIAEAGVFVATP